MRLRKAVFRVVAAARLPVERNAARIGKVHRARGLVKALARRVVARAAEHAQVGVAAHIDDQAVTARRHQTEKRRLEIGRGDVIGRDMAADVVHGNQRLSGGETEPFCKIDPDEQRADQSRPRRDGDGIHSLDRLARVGKSLCGDLVDLFDVTARGDLRHDAAVEPMLGDLGIDDARQHAPSVLDDGGGGLVAGRFDGKNFQRVKRLL